MYKPHELDIFKNNYGFEYLDIFDFAPRSLFSFVFDAQVKMDDFGDVLRAHEPDVAGDITTTGTIALGVSVDSHFDFANDTDWYAITLTAGDSIMVSNSSSETRHIRLYDNAGNRIASNDGFNVTLFHEILVTGSYFIGTKGISPDDYILTANIVPPDIAGDSSTNATISVGQTVSGVLGQGADDDWFAFTANENEVLSFTLSGYDIMSSTFGIYDSNGQLLNLDYRFDDTSVSIITFFDVESTGTYYASVLDATASNDLREYALSLITPADDYAGNITTTGTLTVGGGTESGQIEYRGDTDWFAITVNANDEIEFNVDFVDVRMIPSLELLDSNEAVIATGSNFTHLFVTAGTYYISVYSTHIADTGGYQLTATTSSNITGTAGDDILDGTAGDDYITGLAGNDTLNGFSGNDTLIGGSGNDTVNGGAGDDIIILNQAGKDVVDGGDGFDIVQFTTNDGANTILRLDVLFSPTVSFRVYSDGGSNGLNNVERYEQYDTASGDLYVLGIIATSGNDVIDLSIDNPVLRAVVYGGDGDDTITAGNAFYGNSLRGGNGNDTLTGNYTDDSFEGGAGADTIDGGSGQDSISYLTSNAGVTINLLSGQASGGHAQGDTFTNIENISGSLNFADTLTGDSGDNEIYGSGGDDILDGGAGQDIISGGSGNDTMTGGDGFDIFVNNWHSDITGTITDFEADDVIQILGSSITFEIVPIFIGLANFTGLAGELRYEKTGGHTIIQMDIDGDQLADEVLTITNGEFDLLGLVQGVFGALDIRIDNNINGTSGNDNLVGTINADILSGFDGNDILDGLAGDDRLNGGLGNDRLFGDDGDDTLLGGDGSDTLFGGVGADVLDGGAGFDTVDYRGASSRVALNLSTGGTVGEAAGDIFNSIERVYGSDFNDTITGTSANEFFYGEDGNDTINGGDGIDRIYGGDGNDIQRGQGGNDTLYGSAGSDQLNGGTGFDIARYTDAATGVIVNMATGGTGGDAAGDTYFGIEAVYGSGFNDDITGNTSANQLRGLGGDDTLNGGAGNDSLYGGAGADAMDGGTGIDTVFYDDATSGVIINLDTGGTGGDAAGDAYTSIEWVRGSNFDDDITGEAGNNSIFGNDGNDSLDGWVGNDRLYGGNGDDTINGGQGVDFLYGQDGNDILSGGSENDFFYGSAGGDAMDGGTGTDTVSYLPSSAGVMVNLQTGGSGGDANGDTYTNIERVFGSGFDDTIYGSDGNDVLFGHGGADILGGGLGNDYLSGGAGNDEYVYDTTSGAADTIAGFGSNELIYILGGDADFDTFAEIIAAASNAGANVSFDFGGGNTLTLLGKQISDLDAGDFDFSGTAPTAEAPPQDKIAEFLAEMSLPGSADGQAGSGDADTPTDSNDSLMDMFG